MSLNVEWVVVMSYKGELEPAFCQTVEAAADWTWNDICSEAIELTLSTSDEDYDVICGFKREIDRAWIEAGSLDNEVVPAEAVNVFSAQAAGKTLSFKVATASEDAVSFAAQEILQAISVPVVKQLSGSRTFK